MNQKELDQLAIAAIRSLCIDTINKANSGHPGMALGSAPILHTLFTRHLVANPQDPDWLNRDRFVLSAGHASALLYSMLHVAGYPLRIDDLKNFRQLHSLTPGHPENTETKGVDATTGPLGQGIAQAVGMALAEAALQKQYSEGQKIVDHYTYALCGDGCLFEGVTQEAISFAGHQKLNKLILFYDANDITLDGALELSFSESVKLRFLAAGWDVLEVDDGNDIGAIDRAIKKAKTSKLNPTIIIVKTIIGYGSHNQGTNKVHGAPLGAEDGAYAKKEVYHYDYPDFTVDEAVYQYYQETFLKRGLEAYERNQAAVKLFASNNQEAGQVYQNLAGLDVTKYLPKIPMEFETGSSNSTRNVSQLVLNYMLKHVPHLMGGSADVAHSVMTKIDGGHDFSVFARDGQNINFGIREFGMAAIQNGMLLHGGLRTYVGSFFVFADYMKSAIRHSAISHLPAVYLFSHDSIAVGEDGPTHQPIEHLAMLRSIPNMSVIRPADARETYGAWFQALSSLKTPTAIILSRQNLPVLENSDFQSVIKGGYIVSKAKKSADYIVIATGSEVSLMLEAQKALRSQGIDISVVSMPSVDLFRQQDKKYQESVIGKDYDKRVVVEMLSPFGWHQFAPHVYGVETFGASGKANDVIKDYKFQVEDLVDYIKKLRGGK